MRAQKLRRLAASDRVGFFDVTGDFRLLPVALLYFARPFAVKPAPRFVDNFSPRRTDKDGVFRDIVKSRLSSYSLLFVLAVPQIEQHGYFLFHIFHVNMQFD